MTQMIWVSDGNGENILVPRHDRWYPEQPQPERATVYDDGTEGIPFDGPPCAAEGE